MPIWTSPIYIPLFGKQISSTVSVPIIATFAYSAIDVPVGLVFGLWTFLMTVDAHHRFMTQQDTIFFDKFTLFQVMLILHLTGWIS